MFGQIEARHVDDGGDGFLRQDANEVNQRGPATASGGLRQLKGPGVINASLIGEEHDVVVGVRHQQMLDGIVLAGKSSHQTLCTAVMDTVAILW